MGLIFRKNNIFYIKHGKNFYAGIIEQGGYEARFSPDKYDARLFYKREDAERVKKMLENFLNFDHLEILSI